MGSGKLAKTQQHILDLLPARGALGGHSEIRLYWVPKLNVNQRSSGYEPDGLIKKTGFIVQVKGR